MVASWSPESGDLVWLDFDPQAGHEQAGHRPAIVLSSRKFNQKTHLALVCPITSKIKGNLFELPLPVDSPIQGVILCAHLRSVDWMKREARLIGHAPDALLADLRKRVALIAGIDY